MIIGGAVDLDERVGHVADGRRNEDQVGVDDAERLHGRLKRKRTNQRAAFDDGVGKDQSYGEEEEEELERERTNHMARRRS